MSTFRRLRTFSRFLAAWLVMWFVAMTAGPLAQQPAAGLEAGHHHHAAQQAQPAFDEGTQDLHASHGSGSASHCPLCLHAAAPPPLLACNPGAGDPPSAAIRPCAKAHARVRTDAPPPARGPPVLS
jgi:hypothetical protein